MIIGLECSWHIAFHPGEIILRLGRYRLLRFNWKFTYTYAKYLRELDDKSKQSKLTRLSD